MTEKSMPQQLIGIVRSDSDGQVLDRDGIMGELFG